MYLSALGGAVNLGSIALLWNLVNSRLTYEDALAATKAGNFTMPEAGGMDCVLMCPTEYGSYDACDVEQGFSSFCCPFPFGPLTSVGYTIFATMVLTLVSRCAGCWWGGQVFIMHNTCGESEDSELAQE